LHPFVGLVPLMVPLSHFRQPCCTSGEFARTFCFRPLGSSSALRSVLCLFPLLHCFRDRGFLHLRGNHPTTSYMHSVWFRVCSPTSGKLLLALLCPLVSFCSHPYVLCLALCGASASLGLSWPPPHTALCISGDPSGSFPVLLYCWDAHPKGGGSDSASTDLLSLFTL